MRISCITKEANKTCTDDISLMFSLISGIGFSIFIYQSQIYEAIKELFNT